MKQLKLNAMLMLTAIIWGSAFVAQKQGSGYIGPFSFNGIRLMLAFIFLLFVIFTMDNIKKMKSNYKEKTKSEKKAENKIIIIGGIFCGFFLCVASSFQQIGIEFTTSGKAGFITSLYIVLVPILSLFIFRNSVRKIIWICVLMAVCGVYLLSIKPGGFSVGKGDALVLLCAIFFAMHILVIDYFSPKCDPVKLSCMQFFVASVISIVIMLIFEPIDINAILSAWRPLAFAGIMSGGIGYTLQVVAQKDADPTIASMILSLESVFSVIAGALILNETMTIREISGCIIIFAAIIIAQLPSKNKSGIIKDY